MKFDKKYSISEINCYFYVRNIYCLNIEVQALRHNMCDNYIKKTSDRLLKEG